MRTETATQLPGFVERLQAAAFLLLGQRYLSLETGSDPLLGEITRRYGPELVDKADYFTLFEGTAPNAGDAALAWIDERCRRLSTPKWLETVSDFAWSGVYTSAVDSLLPPALRKAWRGVQPLIDEKYVPSDPRNRRMLHLTYLFGSVNHSDEAARPPLTRFEWSKRRQIAIALSRRLPDLVTPIGTLVIEGYADSRDWLAPDDLLPILDSFTAGQVHLFSTSDQLFENRDVNFLVKKGIVTIHSESLASVLSKASQEGILSLGSTPEEEQSARRVRFGKSSFIVPQELWNQASRSAVILDESNISAPRQISDDARYREFRAFLAGVEGKPNWIAFARGFAFPRDFGDVLGATLHSRLSRHGLASEPVIVHGQTGTGKTVALASVAFAFAQEGQYPVLYVERRSQKPIYSDIDRFCQWAEDAGAPASLVIWDGMVEPDEYSEFLRRLTSRGRKIVLVGSCYQLEAQTAHSLGAVHAPAELSAKERMRFEEFLGAFDPSLRVTINRSNASTDRTFLVALYRILPPTRGAIRAGVTSEAGFAEELLVKRASEIDVVPRAMTVLEQQLRNVGLISSEPPFSELTTAIGGEAVTRSMHSI